MSNIYTTKNYTEFSHLDLFLKEILGDNKEGSFIEIGAFDGETNSKTAHLADIGWRGIYVEPILEYRNRCIARHEKNDVQVLPYAISDINDTSTMYKGGLPSTLKQEHQQHISSYTKDQADELTFEKEKVQCITWDSFRTNHVKEVPDILVVDAEGYDLEIIKSIDFKTFRPTIICCEVFPEGTPFMHSSTILDGEEIKNILVNEGYTIWLQEDHNILFSTKPLPNTLKEIRKNYPYMYSMVYDATVLSGTMSLMRQLLKTLIENKTLVQFDFLVNLFAKQVVGEDSRDSNLLALALLSINKTKEAIRILKWSQSQTDTFCSSNGILRFIMETSSSKKIQIINEVMENSPFSLEYAAMRKIELKK